MDLFQWLLGARQASDPVRIPEGPPAPPIRRQYRFSGCVQGVGFRYEARVTATQLALTGWVRNEDDGSVTAELQGDPRYLEEFVRVILSVPRFQISDLQAEDLPLIEDEKGFRVRY